MRLILLANAAQTAFFMLFLALIGLSGLWWPWGDLVNHFAPLIFILALAAGVTATALANRSARTLLWAVTALSLVFFGSRIAPELVRRGIDVAIQPGIGATGPSLRLATLNVWDENRHPEDTISALLATHPDVLTLQEAYPVVSQSSEILRAALPYSTHCTPAWRCDLMILSRRPIAEAGFVQLDSQGKIWALWARTSGPDGRPVAIVTTHLSWAIPTTHRDQEVARLRLLLSRFDPRELIMAGDFNCTPWSFALGDQDKALAPLQRRSHALFTWPARVERFDRATPFALLPIDQIYTAPTWSKVRISTIRSAGSDHLGLLATFKLH